MFHRELISEKSQSHNFILDLLDGKTLEWNFKEYGYLVFKRKGTISLRIENQFSSDLRMRPHFLIVKITTS